jgi:hypothetical protein
MFFLFLLAKTHIINSLLKLGLYLEINKKSIKY